MVNESIRDVLRGHMLSESGKVDLLNPQTVRVGMRVTTNSDGSEGGSWAIKRLTKKSVSIGLTGGVDLGPKLGGKLLMFRWDGKGFVRQKEYLYPVTKKSQESIQEAKYWDGKSRVFGETISASAGMHLYFTPVSMLKNGNYKGYEVDASSGRPKKAKQKSMDKVWWESKAWTIIPANEVPKAVMKKFDAVI